MQRRLRAAWDTLAIDLRRAAKVAHVGMCDVFLAIAVKDSFAGEAVHFVAMCEGTARSGRHASSQMFDSYSVTSGWALVVHVQCACV